MALVRLIEYAQGSPQVKSVYDDIMKTRGTDWINNFWKALANDPAELARVWANVKQVMAPGTAAARKKSMTDAMLMELLAVVGLANDLRIEVDSQFK